jgi:hypothetical protein
MYKRSSTGLDVRVHLSVLEHCFEVGSAVRDMAVPSWCSRLRVFSRDISVDKRHVIADLIAYCGNGAWHGVLEILHDFLATASAMLLRSSRAALIVEH